MDACAEHLSANAQTSRRIKCRTMNRFKLDGTFPGAIAGNQAPVGGWTLAASPLIFSMDRLCGFLHLPFMPLE
jgi:hypothetical protein